MARETSEGIAKLRFEYLLEHCTGLVSKVWHSPGSLDVHLTRSRPGPVEGLFIQACSGLDAALALPSEATFT